jgi:hypothetical protein
MIFKATWISDSISQALNLAYAVSEMLTQQLNVSAEIARECYAAAQNARAA